MTVTAGVRVTARDGGAAELDEQTIQAFAASLKGGLIRPGDAAYEDGRLRWNGMIDNRPAPIARCSGAADVTGAVNSPVSLGGWLRAGCGAIRGTPPERRNH